MRKEALLLSSTTMVEKTASRALTHRLMPLKTCVAFSFPMSPAESGLFADHIRETRLL